MLIAEFAYNNVKNASTGHTPFKFNCGYHPKIFFKKDIDLCSKSRSANKLTEKPKELIKVYCQNLLPIQNLQMKANDNGVKSWSYALDKKVWLNSKYIITKKNKKLESKFFGSFWVLWATYQVEDTQYIPYVTAGAGHHKEKTSG